MCWCVLGESVAAQRMCEKSVFDLKSHFHAVAIDDLSNEGWSRHVLKDKLKGGQGKTPPELESVTCPDVETLDKSRK